MVRTDIRNNSTKKSVDKKLKKREKIELSEFVKTSFEGSNRDLDLDDIFVEALSLSELVVHPDDLDFNS